MLRVARQHLVQYVQERLRHPWLIHLHMRRLHFFRERRPFPMGLPRLGARIPRHTPKGPARLPTPLPRGCRHASSYGDAFLPSAAIRHGG